MRKHLFLFLSLLLASVANAQLSGTYTISSNASPNPDYTSFSAAALALSVGVSGQVIFEVAPGTYEEYVTLNSITGTSATNRVIFRGMGADNQQVVVTSNAGYTENSTLKLDGADYVTFENLTLASTSDNTAIVVTLRGGLTEDRFENVRFVGCVSDASNTDNNKNLVYRVSGGWMDTNNAFFGCEFVNGFIGLYYQGQSMSQYNDGLLVENCIFSNQCSKSIYATFTDHVTLSGNTITNSNDTHTDYNAIDIFRCRYGCLVENNVMTVNHPTKYATVMKLRPCTGSATEPIIVRNNIVDFQGAGSSWCYSFDNADSEHIYFAHNTARCSGSGNSGNLFVQKDWEHFYAYNNLFVNETGGYVFRFNNASANRFCDYNRVSFTGGNVGIIAGEDCATLADWTATSGFDAHTTLCSPQFEDAHDLHVTSSEGLTVAHPLDYVTVDIDGDTRSNTPCAGADECVSVVVDLPPVVSNQLAPINFTEYPQSFSFDISECFDDPDNDNLLMEYTVQTCPSEISASIDGEDMLLVSRTTPDDFTNRTLVIRATSNGKYVDMSVDVSGAEVVVDVNIAHFEDVELASNGIWQPPFGSNEMLSGGWLFTNNTQNGYWGGFTASNRTDLNQTGLNAQYTAAPGCGYDGSSQYAVAYTMGMQTEVYAADGQLHTVTGCYVTNDLWTYQDMLQGGYGEPPYGGSTGNDPDWFKVTATGKNASGQTVGTLDFYLADFRFANNEEDYVLNTWEWFDLSPLGNVSSISFSLSSSRGGGYDMITPAYFCMDDFNGSVTVDLPPYVVHQVQDVVMDEFPKLVYVDLDGVVTDDDDSDELIEYSLLSNSNEAALAAALPNKILSLERLTEDQAEADVAIRATSNGQSVDFNVHVIMNHVEGLEEHQFGLMAYPNPTDGLLMLSLNEVSSFNYCVFDLVGQCVMSGNAQGNETRLDLGGLNKGLYLISVEWNGNRMMQIITVR